MIEAKTKQSIIMLRLQGESFVEIAKLLSLSPNTVKSICHRSNIHTLSAEKTDSHVCKNCGQPLVQIPGKKHKTFCSTGCRTAWWNKTRSRKPYRLTCYCCGKMFISFGNKKKKFCCQECRQISRYGEEIT